jgi:hypothetical protein
VRPYHQKQNKTKNRAKGTGGVVQIIECLPSKCGAQSSNSSDTRKGKKKNSLNAFFRGSDEI